MALFCHNRPLYRVFYFLARQFFKPNHSIIGPSLRMRCDHQALRQTTLLYRLDDFIGGMVNPSFFDPFILENGYLVSNADLETIPTTSCICQIKTF